MIVTGEFEDKGMLVFELTFWRPRLPYGYIYNASCARLG